MISRSELTYLKTKIVWAFTFQMQAGVARSTTEQNNVLPTLGRVRSILCSNIKLA